MNESTSRNRTYSNAIFISEQPQRKKIVDTSGNNIKMENGKMVTGKRSVDILNSNGANIKGKSRAQLPPITDVSGLPLTDAPVLSPSDNYIHPGWEKAGEILDERRNRLNELRSNPTGKSIPTSNVITDVNGKTLKREPITSKPTGSATGASKTASAGSKASSTAKSTPKAKVNPTKGAEKSFLNKVDDFVGSKYGTLAAGGVIAGVALGLGMMLGDRDD